MVSWHASDFGGALGEPIENSLGFSVTCNLPPQTAIDVAQGDFEIDIGSA